MSDLVDKLFGNGSDLDALQMVDRGIAVFVLALLMVRMAGRRSFGQHRPFDACTTVLLGAVLSWAVVGASPFWPTMLSGVAIVAMHRLIGMASVRWPGFERLVSGDDPHEMRRALISERDLDEVRAVNSGRASLRAGDREAAPAASRRMRSAWA